MDGLTTGIMTGILTSFFALSALQALRNPTAATHFGNGTTLAFGKGYRMFWCAGMLLGFNGTYVLFAKATYPSLWIPATLSVLLCSVFYFYLHNAYIYRVKLSPKGVSVRELFRGEKSIDWDAIQKMYYSRHLNCLIISDGQNQVRIGRFVDGTNEFKAAVPSEVETRFGEELAFL